MKSMWLVNLTPPDKLKPSRIEVRFKGPQYGRRYWRNEFGRCYAIRVKEHYDFTYYAPTDAAKPRMRKSTRTR